MSAQKEKAGTKTAGNAKAGAAKAAPAADELIPSIIADIQEQMQAFSESEEVNYNLSQAERKRLIGAGVKNYGLIDKAFDIARDNPSFMPPFLTPQDMWNDMHNFEEIRQLVMVLEKFLQIANECMMIRGDRCFRDALRIYDSLKEMSKNNVPGAKPLFESLMSFFRRRRRPGEAEPTMKELERDIHSLLHGTADGKIVIQNETPKTKAGVRKIVDDVHRGRGMVKVSAEEDVED